MWGDVLGGLRPGILCGKLEGGKVGRVFRASWGEMGGEGEGDWETEDCRTGVGGLEILGFQEVTVGDASLMLLRKDEAREEIRDTRARSKLIESG